MKKIFMATAGLILVFSTQNARCDEIKQCSPQISCGSCVCNYVSADGSCEGGDGNQTCTVIDCEGNISSSYDQAC